MIEPPTVIVLAAGKGERFKASGGTQDKLNALLNGKSVRDHVLEAVKASGLPFHVVKREHTQHLNNPGMSDSIACGVAVTPNANGWLILPADLPLIQATTLLEVASALRTYPVVVPYYQGQPGHPVGFQKTLGQALCQLTGDTGARSVVTTQTFLKLDVADAGAVFDVDTQDRLEEASLPRIIA